MSIYNAPDIMTERALRQSGDAQSTVSGFLTVREGQSLVIRRNSGADVGARPRLNLIEGTNITLTVVDDAINDEVDVTITGAAAGAPTNAQFIVLAANASLSDERVLTGTADQIILTDAGAGAALTLSTPQNLHSGATPLFARIGIGAAADVSTLAIVQKSSATLPTVLGLPMAFATGSPSGTVPWALRQNATEASTPVLAWFETSSGDLGYIAARSGSLAIGGYTSKGLVLIANNTDSVLISTSGNVGVGVTAFGTSAAKVIGIGNGTEPTTSPADMVQLYSVDLSAGNATLGIRTETAVVTESVTSDRTLSVRINGTTYKICLKS
jgi:hypothetical protein